MRMKADIENPPRADMDQKTLNISLVNSPNDAVAILYAEETRSHCS